MRVVVIGGGAVGVTTAYFLSRRGIDVTLFDADALGNGTSFGNAGLLVPSYSLPLTSWPNFLEGLRSLLGFPAAVEFNLGYGLRQINWLTGLLISAVTAGAADRFKTLAQLCQRSLALYSELLRSAPDVVSYSVRGVSYIYATAGGLDLGRKLAAAYRDVGVLSAEMGPQDARYFEPLLSSAVTGVIRYAGDGNVQPFQYVNWMAGVARKNGVAFRVDTRIALSMAAQNRVEVRCGDERILADRVVVAAGYQSPELMKPVGISVPILPAKGYSMDVSLAQKPNSPMLFQEDHVSLTPFGNNVRVTTGLDFHGHDRTINPSKPKLMRDALSRYLDSPVVVDTGTPWSGFRPLTPDGLPIIGPSSRLENVVYATGHGPLGITLAPATADLVERCLLDSVDVAVALRPSRFHI